MKVKKMNLLDELENAMPIKKDVTPSSGWPLASKVFAWKLPDEQLLMFLGGMPKGAIEDSAEGSPERDKFTISWVEYGVKLLSKSLSSEIESGLFDNDRGIQLLQRLPLSVKNELIESVRNFLEFTGPSEDRKK
jgi:hypothetical protein